MRLNRAPAPDNFRWLRLLDSSSDQMPTYEFRCKAGHLFDQFFRSMNSAPTEVACPQCGQPAERLISGGAGLLFKGSGFYITDYGKDGKKVQGSSGGARADAGGSEGKAEGKAEGKGEGKTESKAGKPEGGSSSGGSGSGGSSGTSGGSGSSGSSSGGGA